MVCVTLTDHESPMICRLYSKLLLWRCHLHEFIQDFPSVFSNSKIGGSCDFAWAWAWLQVWVVHGCGEYLNDLGNEDRAISLDSLVLTAAHRNHRGSTWCQGVWRHNKWVSSIYKPLRKPYSFDSESGVKQATGVINCHLRFQGSLNVVLNPIPWPSDVLDQSMI